MNEINARSLDWTKKNGVWFGVAEASRLGFAPGYWPSVLIVRGKTDRRIFHNETLPHPDALRRANEEGHHYGDGRGCFIHVLND